jgi:hypothetical protein
MKAQELRIGNYVFIDSPDYWPELKNIPVIVCGIDDRKDNAFPDSSGVIGIAYSYYNSLRVSQFDEFVKPIPLTEELLLKLGFENNGKEDASWIHPKEPLFEVTFFVEYEWQHIWDTSYTGAQIQYLHQLQNLFYALNGEELEIKL